MGVSVVGGSTGGSSTNIGTLAGGSLTFQSGGTGTTVQFTTVYPMAAGAYEFNFKRLSCIRSASLKITLSLNGTSVGSTTVSNPPSSYGSLTVYITSTSDFDTISLYNDGNVFQSDGSSTNPSLVMTAGRRSSTAIENLTWTRLADSPAVTSSPALYANNPGYYNFMVANTAGTKLYYSYENAGDNTAPNVAPKLFEYDIATNTHTEKASLPTLNNNNTHFARNAIFVNNKLYIQGGAIWNGANWQYTNNLYEYDPSSNTWATKTAGGPVAYSHVYSPNSNTINFFNSWSSQNGNFSENHWSYSISGNSWSTLNYPTGSWNATNTVSYPNRTVSFTTNVAETPTFYDPTANVFWVGVSSTSGTANYPIYLKYTVSTGVWSLDDNLGRNPNMHSTSAQYGYSGDNRDANTASSPQSFRYAPAGWYSQKMRIGKIGSKFIVYSSGITNNGAATDRFLSLPDNNPFYGSVTPTYSSPTSYMYNGFLTIGTKIYGFQNTTAGNNRTSIYVADTASLNSQPSYAI